MKNTIKCTKCGAEIKIGKALRHQLEEEIKSNQDKLFEEKLQSVKADLEKKAKEQANKEIRYRDEQINSLTKRAEEAESNEFAIRKEKQELADEKRKFELEKQRQLDEERETIRKKAREEQMDRDKLTIKDRDKQIEMLKKSVNDLQRKSNIGSQQLQGEVQELALEEVLKVLFPEDSITEVKKGELGADVRQLVKTTRGTVCGTILWESKRTKSWDKKWPKKLKEDKQRDKADIGVVVTENLPRNFKREFGFDYGVWITLPKHIEPLATALRKNLYDVKKEKVIATNKQNQADELYDYVTSNVFTQNVERMVDTYLEMKLQIAKERASSERLFKLREGQVDKLLTGVSGIYGSLENIAGSALPQIKQLHSGE
jgi:hypothetical protein